MHPVHVGFIQLGLALMNVPWMLESNMFSTLAVGFCLGTAIASFISYFLDKEF